VTDEQRKARNAYNKRYRLAHPEKCKNYQLKANIKTGAWISQIEYTAKWIDRVETLNHYLDGIAEDAATQEILHLAERRYA
jgi:hypothetical protein